ncbi:MAG: permease prefix domain 1-containing protein [Nocardioidaceae bacterium]
MSVLDSYIAELDAALHGSRRRRRDLLREAQDHLIDAADAHLAAGLPPEEAEHRAVREFGDAAMVAPAYQAILSVEQSRRLGVWLFLVVLVQPFAWGAWNTNAADESGSSVSARLDALVEISGLAAMAFATLAVVGCGVAVRIIGVREWLLRLVLTSALVSSVLILAISVAMFAASGTVTALAVGYISVVVWIPMSVIAVASLLALRAVAGASELRGA